MQVAPESLHGSVLRPGTALSRLCCLAHLLETAPGSAPQSYTTENRGIEDCPGLLGEGRSSGGLGRSGGRPAPTHRDTRVRLSTLLVTRNDYHVTMIEVGVAELKARLSRHLKVVREGREVTDSTEIRRLPGSFPTRVDPWRSVGPRAGPAISSSRDARRGRPTVWLSSWMTGADGESLPRHLGPAAPGFQGARCARPVAFLRGAGIERTDRRRERPDDRSSAVSRDRSPTTKPPSD